MFLNKNLRTFIGVKANCQQMDQISLKLETKCLLAYVPIEEDAKKNPKKSFI